MDKATLARGLGIGALLYAALAVVLYFAGGHRYVRSVGVPDAAALFLVFGVPLLASITGTVLYTRLPKEQQRSAFIAPVSLILLMLLPTALFVLFIWALARLGDL